MIVIDKGYFHLATEHSSYVMKVLETGQLVNVVYGERLDSLEGIEFVSEPFGFHMSDSVSFNEDFPEYYQEKQLYEYPTGGTGDYRESALEVEYEEGLSVLSLSFSGAQVVKGKDCSFPAHALYDDSVETLVITLSDDLVPVRVLLRYTVYEKEDVILRSARIMNASGDRTFRLRNAASLSLDLNYSDFTLLSYDGAHLREREEHQRELLPGITVIDSKLGTSSNEHNPLIFLRRRTTGGVYGFNLIYSGSHRETVEVSPFGKTRVISGINPSCFSWTLEPGKSFETPEAVMSYGPELEDVSLSFHCFVNTYIVRGAWKGKERPVLINNWEATYFDFTEDKLMDIARTASDLGFELFVLDDGWFGSRRDDTRGLGDWYADRTLFPEGLGSFADKIRALGLGFGLWIEPEMVNFDSDLYRAHPDWVIAVPGRKPAVCRSQYVLDLSRGEVVDYLFQVLSGVFREARPSYIKWDMNRPLTDCYSKSLSNQGEVMHRYVLGVYSLLEKLTGAFPEILFEGCSSGGNRYDLGMFCFVPQFWCSDNTDSYHRIGIQQGTLRGYPQSTMGAHVSAVPAHHSLRTTSIESRFDVAAFGVLGYELDISKLTDGEKEAVRSQISFYKKYRSVFQYGTFRRVPSEDSNLTWWAVGKDGITLVLEAQSRNMPNTGRCDLLRLPFLRKDKRYRVHNRVERIPKEMLGALYPSYGKEESERFDVIVPGSVLSTCGIRLPAQFMGTGCVPSVRPLGDNGTRLYVVEEA